MTVKKPVKKKNRKCIRCDGIGLLCDICGESEAACRCREDGKETTFSECHVCGGSGK